MKVKVAFGLEERKTMMQHLDEFFDENLKIYVYNKKCCVRRVFFVKLSEENDKFLKEKGQNVLAQEADTHIAVSLSSGTRPVKVTFGLA